MFHCLRRISREVWYGAVICKQITNICIRVKYSWWAENAKQIWNMRNGRWLCCNRKLKNVFEKLADVCYKLNETFNITSICSNLPELNVNQLIDRVYLKKWTREMLDIYFCILSYLGKQKLHDFNNINSARWQCILFRIFKWHGFEIDDKTVSTLRFLRWFQWLKYFSKLF